MTTKAEEPFDALNFDTRLSPSLDGFDQDAVFGDILNLDDEPLFQESWNLQDTPPYDQGGLYSTPLSWDAPQARAPVQPKVEAVQPASMVSLTTAQQELLRSIAMPEHLQYQTTQGLSPQSATSTYKSGSVSSPEHQDLARKRKSTSEEIEEEASGDEGVQRPVKKTAHNMIEKRYRTNLNDKIAALRDSVPSLRVMAKSARGEDASGEKEDLQGLTPAHKLNKATVLAKATEYIRHLEKRSKRLAEDNASMKARIAAFEKLFLSGSMGINPPPPPSHQFTFGQDQFMNDATGQMNGQITPNVSPRGMIEIPENFRRIHQAQQMNQQTYQIPQETYQPMGSQGGTNPWSSNGAYFGKLMVGSLAGLMILDGFSESQSTGEASDSKGLFAVPTQLLGSAARYIRASGEINAFGCNFSAAQTFGYLRLLLMIGAMVYVFVPSFFSMPLKPNDGKAATAPVETVPSLASPIQVRRQAWLTAVQTVWIPRHNFVLEVVALLLKMLKLSIRNLIGAYGYAIITGTTDQREAARIKAWSIALDAQLVGGDIDVSKSRLTLTLLASGTLPDTPNRLMLKALHMRVLLWELGNGALGGSYLIDDFAIKLARWKWNEARRLQQLLTHVNARSPAADFEPLPDHLVALLNQDADDVLADSVVQRAYNLAWNLPTTHNAQGDSDGMDGIVDDHTIRSPLDAVAAWFSSMTLHKALETSLLPAATPAAAAQADLDARTRALALAIATAPEGSGARLGALIARAVLDDTDRTAHIAAALQEFDGAAPPAASPDAADDAALAASGAVPTLITSLSSVGALPDLHLALTCAQALAQLERPTATGRACAFPIIGAIAPSGPLSLLSFASCYKLLGAIVSDEATVAGCVAPLEKLAGALRIWIGGAEGARSGLRKETREGVVERCIAVSRGCVGMEGSEGDDAGYESMSDSGEGC